MDNRTLIKDLLAQVSTLAKVEFTLNEDGFCDLAFEDLNLVISVPEESDFVHFYAFLVPIPPQI